MFYSLILFKNSLPYTRVVLKIIITILMSVHFEIHFLEPVHSSVDGNGNIDAGDNNVLVRNRSKPIKSFTSAFTLINPWYIGVSDDVTMVCWNVKFSF